MTSARARGLQGRAAAGARPQPAPGASWPQATSATLPSPAPRLAQPPLASLALLAPGRWLRSTCLGPVALPVAVPVPGPAVGLLLVPWALPGGVLCIRWEVGPPHTMSPCTPRPSCQLSCLPALAPAPFPAIWQDPILLPLVQAGYRGPGRLPGSGAAVRCGQQDRQPLPPHKQDQAVASLGPQTLSPAVPSEQPSAQQHQGVQQHRCLGQPGRQESWQLLPKHLQTVCPAVELGTWSPLSRSHPTSWWRERGHLPQVPCRLKQGLDRVRLPTFPLFLLILKDKRLQRLPQM